MWRANVAIRQRSEESGQIDRTKHRSVLPLCLLALLFAVATGQAQDLDQIGEGPAVTVGGSINGRTTYRTTTGDEDRASALLSGSLSIDLYGLSLPFSFAIGTEDRSFSQPFNQFGLSPQYKWITAHLGHRNLTHSEWTLSGHQIFGAGLEIAPGPFRASFIAGRLRAPIVADTTDTLTSGDASSAELRRTGYAGMIGYRGDAFDIELSGLLAADDTTGSEATAILADGALPAENAVGALAVALRPVDGLQLRFTAGLSEYTRDVRSETIEIDDDFAALGEIQQPRLSTQVYTGIKAEASYTGTDFSVRAGYSRIDPDFQSMGTYYTSSDIEALTFGSTVSLAERRLNLSGNLAISHDNVTGKKRATTSTFAPTLTIDWRPSTPFGISLNVNTRLLSQEAGTVPLEQSTRLENETRTITILPRYSIIDTATVHSFSAVATHMQLFDENEETAPFTTYASTTGSIGYNMTRVQSGISINGAVSLTTIDNSGGSQQTLGGSIGGRLPILADRLSADGSIAAGFSTDARTLSGSTGLAYRDGKHHTITLGLAASNAQREGADENDNASTTEFRGVASYGYRF